jgi:hypothetical protein
MVLIMMARLCGVVALALGAARWMGAGIPLDFHMAFGGLTVVALWGLAWQSGQRAPALAVVAGLWGVAVPVLGIMQLHLVLGDNQWIPQAIHVVAGLGAIGLAESLNKGLRRSELLR